MTKRKQDQVIHTAYRTHSITKLDLQSMPAFSLLLKLSVMAIILVVASCESENPPVFRKPYCLSTRSPASLQAHTLDIPRGGSWLPAGYHPYGYGITDLGLEFLKFEGSLDSDIGRYLASLKTGRKKRNVLREQWVEVVRVSKAGQSMRILRTLDDLIEFCIKVGFID